MVKAVEWGWTTIGDQFEIQLGKMLDAARNAGTPKPYLSNRNIRWGAIDAEELPMVPMSAADLVLYRLQPGDLLVCEGGEIGRAAIWSGDLEECYYQKALHRLRPSGTYEPRLLQHYLRYWAGTGLIQKYVTGTGIPHLPKEKLALIPLPLLPAKEQEAIAEVLGDADAAIEALDALIAKKRDVKQAAMQQLLTGRTRLPAFTAAWEVVRLGDLGSFSKGQGIKKDEVVGDGLPCIRYGQIYTDHNDWIRSFTAFIERGTAQGSRRLERGELLFTGSGETATEIGKCVAFVGTEEAYAGGDIVILTPRGLDARFMGYALNAPAVAQQKMRLAQGDAVVHISASSLASLEVELPGLEEQAAIAQVLMDMDAEVEALSAEREKLRLVKQGMMQELLSGRVRLV